MKKKVLTVHQIKKPSKAKRLLKGIFSPVFYVWAITFALVGTFIMVIEERKEDQQAEKREFEKSIKELKDSVKNDLERHN